MFFKINDYVKWVGKIDWDLTKFHGEEYSVRRGSSYNSYLIEDEKNVLIDTVWKPFSREFVNNLESVIDLEKIDYIVANHGEIDHSGALPELMEKIPNVPIYCTQNAVDSITGHYHKDWNFKIVKTGDTLDIGKNKLIFIEAKMLHWPDTMMTYMSGENILFSNDAFGQHYASEQMYNDLAEKDELFAEAIKYYANILTPFSKLVINKIKELQEMKVPVNMILPSHGIIWRDNPMQIVEKYLEWANNYQENQITLLYDTMWNGTKRIAETIAKGIKSIDKEVTVKLLNTGKKDKNDVLTEVFKSKTIGVGSPTINQTVLHSVAGILDMIKSLKFRGKNAFAYGTYGWSGESTKIINRELEKANFSIINEPLLVKWNPNDEDLKKAYELGIKLAK